MQAPIRNCDRDRVIFGERIEAENGGISGNNLGLGVPAGKRLRVQIGLEASLGSIRANSVCKSTWCRS